MARTIEEIQTEIYTAKEGQEALSELNSTSKTAIYRLMIYIVAVCIYTFEKILDKHDDEIDEKLYNQKSGTLRWYRYMALKFQYGFDLITDTDEFDNEGATESEIDDSKIIKFAAVGKGDQNGEIVVKIATEVNDVLAPITEDQRTSIEAYFNEIVYAGNEVTVINNTADKLYLSLKIYRDALVLDSNGANIITTETVVENAIQEFMKELKFDGELILAELIDKLQAVPGVRIPHLVYASHSYVSGEGYTPAEYIDVKQIPQAGYFEAIIDSIEYVV